MVEDCHVRNYELTSRYEDNVTTEETRESLIQEDLALSAPQFSQGYVWCVHESQSKVQEQS